MTEPNPWDVINSYLEHYGLGRIPRVSTWDDTAERILALLRHMEDVLPAPLPKPQHPLYPERNDK